MARHYVLDQVLDQVKNTKWLADLMVQYECRFVHSGPT